jgi:predicted RNA-binding Zn-ribbon protein involved in translation (DUF1610 family)
VNRYWDEKRRNMDTVPLDAREIAKLKFDKDWCASVAQDYGSFIYFSENEKAMELFDLSKTIYLELADNVSLKRLENMLAALEKIVKQGNLPRQSGFTGLTPQAAMMQSSYIHCASCGRVYQEFQRKCPNCGEKTCPNCGQAAGVGNEYCENCDYWLGS